MSRGLAIETSGRLGSIALLDDGQVLDERHFEHGLQHAATILPLIDAACAAQHWTPADLRRIYVSAGPGSFTGLRIGITLAKTVAFATGARIIAVPTLDVLAQNAPADARNLLVVLDAKRQQIYTALYERAAAGWRPREPAHLDSLDAVLKRTPRPLHLLGEGIPYHRMFIPAGGSITITAPDTWRARASAVAQLGLELARQRRFADPFTLSPIYIRRPEAEEKYAAGNPPRA